MSHSGISWRTGDWAIYRMTKRSVHPGPRARQVSPEPLGEGYVYVVPKFWVVERTFDDGRVALRTRRGKTHVLRGDDPDLRPARWWERMLHRHRFPELGRATTA